MAFWEQFPYTNFHDMNLDWLLKEVLSLRTRIEQYTAVNRVAYAGLWDITKQYPQWSLVSTGDKTYMSSKAVPLGVDITNDEYWIHLADIDPRINGILQDIDEIQTRINVINGILPNIDTLQTRINNFHIVNVLDYGAVGNGETDDTAALQRAIDNTPVHGTLYIPYTGSSYITYSTLNVRKPISIIGGYIGYEYMERVNDVTKEEVGRPLIRYKGSGYAFDFDTLGYYISGVAIVSNGSGFHFHLTEAVVDYSRIGKIENCHVTHNGIGFNFEKAFRVTLDNVNSYGGVVGFKVADATSFLFNNTWARNFRDSGYNVTEASYCGFNVACCDGEEERTIGYYFKDCYTISMSGCGVERCGLFGISCDNVRGGEINLKFADCGTLENGAPASVENYSNVTFVGCHNNLIQEAPKRDVNVGSYSVCNVLTCSGLATAKIINTSYNISDGVWSSANPGNPV